MRGTPISASLHAFPMPGIALPRRIPVIRIERPCKKCWSVCPFLRMMTANKFAQRTQNKGQAHALDARWFVADRKARLPDLCAGGAAGDAAGAGRAAADG